MNLRNKILAISIEKGWADRATYNSYTRYVTEDPALEVIKYDSDYLLILKTIIENLN